MRTFEFPSCNPTPLYPFLSYNNLKIIFFVILNNSVLDTLETDTNDTTLLLDTVETDTNDTTLLLDTA